MSALCRRSSWLFFTLRLWKRGKFLSLRSLPSTQLTAIARHSTPYSPPPLFPPEVLSQFRRHVLVYAELLFRWELFHKRLELLKAVEKPGIPVNKERSQHQEDQQHGLGLVRMCARPDCPMLLEPKTHVCSHCGTPSPLPGCTICRLPVKGSSFASGLDAFTDQNLPRLVA